MANGASNANDPTPLAVPGSRAAGGDGVVNNEALPLAVPGSRAAGGEGAAPKWPHVKCNGCDTIAKWKKIRSMKVWEHYQEFMTDQDDSFTWAYTCVECLAKELECTEQEAKARILGASATPAWARGRNAKFKAAFQNRREEFPGRSRDGARTLVRNDLVEVLEPLAEFAARKLIQLKARQQGIEEYDKLLVEHRAVKEKDRELTIIEELENWDQVLEKPNAPLAFQGKEGAEQTFNAAQCSDEWVNADFGALGAWHVCLQGWGGQCPPCGAVMPSKQWRRKFEGIGSSKQERHCVCCQTRFRTGHGMLVEVRTVGVSTFMLAEVSNQDVEDVRAMYLDKNLNPKNHNDLWQKIPDFTPIDPRDILRPVEMHELAITEGFDMGAVSKFANAQRLKAVLKWDWDQIFSLLE
ncbi:unnamed protein product [Prorocentrum cordatum]|uniref:Uncharacterized protein n=1 Tax=Prorocentrum cordatum TaxID=2364126 RepID=A0ABN9U3I2_9DINO|nr:unnamed protein product [Polarella glacialis]